MTDQASPRNDRLRNWIGSVLVVLCCFPCLQPVITFSGEVARFLVGDESPHLGYDLAQAQLNTLKTAIIQYKTLNRQLPSNEQGLWALVQPPENARVKKALMSDSAILDPWGNPFRYRTPGQRSDRPFDVWSLGPDGVDGTADDIFPD